MKKRLPQLSKCYGLISQSPNSNVMDEAEHAGKWVGSSASGPMTVESDVKISPTKSTVNSLLSAPILPTLLRLTAPNLIAMVAMALVAIAETSYVGLLGTPSLAGMALVFPMVMLQQMMSSGAMGGGISSAISRAIGANEHDRASALALHAVAIGATAGLGFTTIFLIWGRPIYQLLGGREEALTAAMAYSNVVFLGAVGTWLTNTLASIVRGGGNMKIPSITILAVAGAQVLIGGGLGLGIGPLPRLGMAGIAVGQVAAFTGGAVFLLW